MTQTQQQSVLDPLGYPVFPELGPALKTKKERILQRWEESALRLLPDLLDKLTHKQLRDHLPHTLDRMIAAFGAGEDEDELGALERVQQIAEDATSLRFEQDFDVKSLLIEFRLLRRIMREEVYAELGLGASEGKMLSVDMAVDVSLQQAVVSLVGKRNEQLQHAAAAESRYLAFLSHDLRNQLNSITLVLQLLGKRLKNQPGFDDEAKNLEMARRFIAETMAGMDRLIHGDRLRSGAVHVKAQPVNLHDLVDQAVGLVAPEAGAKGLHLAVQVPGEAVVSSDRPMLALAVYNILSNAVKYAPKGTVRIDAERWRQNGKQGWRLSVTDEGPGISPENLERLFQAFARGETHGEPGIGLGLTIASQAIEALGGKVEVESQVGSGSSFRMTIFDVSEQT